jgi:hypothetical protein
MKICKRDTKRIASGAYLGNVFNDRVFGNADRSIQANPIGVCVNQTSQKHPRITNLKFHEHYKDQAELSDCEEPIILTIVIFKLRTRKL